MRWDIGIDLGTRNVRMVTEGAQEAFAQPAALAVRAGAAAPLCFGDAALALYGRESEGVEVCFPVSDGTLRNAGHAQALLGWLYARGETAHARRLRVLITCAPFARPVQQDALLQAALDAGAAEAGLMRADAVVAVGAGLPILAPEASLLVDVGAGKISATLFTRGLIAAYAYLPYGVARIDERLARMLRTERGFCIGPRTAEDVKIRPRRGGQRRAGAHARGRAEPADAPAHALRRGAGDGRAAPPRACSPELLGMVASVVDNAPEELAADLNDAGCVLAGGGALIPGLDKRLGDHLGIPVRVADAPLACAGAGLGEDTGSARGLRASDDGEDGPRRAALSCIKIHLKRIKRSRINARERF